MLTIDSLLILAAVVGRVHGGVHSGVQVSGTTKAAGFKRLEGFGN